MNEQEKTVELLKYILKSKKLDDAIKRLDFGINLFGKPISEDKHIFLRIVRPKDKLVISVRRDIPKKDKNDYWIDFPINNSKLQFITPNVEYIPAI